MQHLSHYGARLVEERKKKERRWTVLTSVCFRFSTLKQLLHVAVTTVDWGKLFKLLCVLKTLTFASRLWYRYENANTLIGAAILKSGHPYIWARYCEPIIVPSSKSELLLCVLFLFMRENISILAGIRVLYGEDSSAVTLKSSSKYWQICSRYSPGVQICPKIIHTVWIVRFQTHVCFNRQ